MGCGSSSVAQSSDVSGAVAILPTAGGGGVASAVATTKSKANRVETIAEGTHEMSDPRGSESAPSDESDPILRAAVTAAHEAASRLFATRSLDTISTLDLPIDFDLPSSHFLGEVDLELLIEYFTTSERCQLFTEASSRTLEITRTNLAELCLHTGSIEETIRILNILDTRHHSKFETLSDLPRAIAEQQRREVEANIRHMPTQLMKGVLDAYDLLSRSTCTLHPFSKLPTIVVGGSSNDVDELDFISLNTSLTSARMRLKYMSVDFLTMLAHSCGHDGRDVGLVLGHLTLFEDSFETPNKLLRASLKHRIKSNQTLERLLKRNSNAAGSTTTPMTSVVVPNSLSIFLPDLEDGLHTISKGLLKLQPHLSPLTMMLQQLTSTLQHLRTYIEHFQTLLIESFEHAHSNSIEPEDDSKTFDILKTYLVTFLSLLQPWLLQLRPYLGSLQPFFQDLQPFLTATHGTFTRLVPFLHELKQHTDGVVDENGDGIDVGVGVDGVDIAFLLPSSSFHLFLRDILLTRLIDLHPLLHSLHPLMLDFTCFFQQLDPFLQQLESIVTKIRTYQTMTPESMRTPKEEEAEDGDDANEHSRSTIAIPWVSSSDAGDGDDDGTIDVVKYSTCPTFLSHYGRILPTLSSYIEPLRPFVQDVSTFVQRFIPFIQQLSPFYRSTLKAYVVPLTFMLLPTDIIEEKVMITKADNTQDELDEATLQRLLSS